MPTGLSNDGHIVGFAQGSSVVAPLGLSWAAASGIEILAAPARLNGIAPNSGQIVGDLGWPPELPRPASWSGPGGSGPLQALYAGAPQYGTVGGVNDAGWVMAVGWDGDNPTAESTRLRLLRPGMEAIDLGQGLFVQFALRVANGIAAGTLSTSAGFSAVTWTEARGARTFNVLGDSSTLVRGVSDRGLVVGTISPAGGLDRGFLHDSSGGGTLQVWSGFTPWDINGAGLVVGSGPGGNAAAWGGGAVVDLNTRVINLGQYQLSWASRVNDRGQITALANPTLAGLAAGLLPTVALLSVCSDTCGQIKPYPNPAGTTLTIGSDWFDAHNAVNFVNHGELVLSTGVLNREAGVIDNRGLITITAGGSLVQDGTLNQRVSGRLQIAGGFDQLAGASFNAGTVELLAGGTAFIAGAGWLNDAGSRFVVDGGSLVLSAPMFVAGSEFVLRDGNVSFADAAQFSVLGGDVLLEAGALGNRGDLLVSRDLVSAPGRASTLTVQAGAVLDNLDTGQLRVDRASTLDLDGVLRNTGRLTLDGTATRLTVWDGGRLDNRGRITVQNGARLELAVDGPLDWSDGRLDVRAGGRLEVGSTTRLFSTVLQRTDNAGRIELNGGQWHSAAQTTLLGGSQTRLNSGGRIDVEAGRFEIAPGALVIGDGSFTQHAGVVIINGELAAGLATFSGGVLSGSGVVSGPAVIGSGVTATGSVLLLKPGNSPGMLSFADSVTLDGVDIEVEVASWRRADVLRFDGPVTVLGARGLLRPDAAYEPDLNDRFEWLRVAESARFDGGHLLVVDTSALSAVGDGGWSATVQTDAQGSRLRIDHAAAVPFAFDAIAPGVRVEIAAGQRQHIANGRVVGSEGELAIAGALAVREGAGLIASSGTMHIATGGRLSTRGDISQDGDGLLNEGLLRVYEDGSLMHTGPLRNRGLVENAGSWVANARIDNEAGGRIVQIGSLSSFRIDNTGRFELEGELLNRGFVDNRAGGEFIVMAGGVLRTAAFGSGRYSDRFGRTQVDGRLEAETITLQGSRVNGSGVIAGKIAGDALFELGDGSAAPLTIEGVLGGSHRFSLDIVDATRFGSLSVLGDTALTGGTVTFWLTEGGYVPQAGDVFSWLALSGDGVGLSALDFEVRVRTATFDYAWVVHDDLALRFDGRTLTVAVVPEPGTYALMLAGLGLVAWLKRRRPGREEAAATP